jgi:hypothetical protein
MRFSSIVVCCLVCLPSLSSAQSVSRYTFEPTKDAACIKARSSAKAAIDKYCGPRGGIHGLSGGRCSTRDASSLYDGKTMYKGTDSYQVQCKR